MFFREPGSGENRQAELLNSSRRNGGEKNSRCRRTGVNG